jgi:hypothetical protein
MDDAQTVSHIVDLVSSGGGMALLGWAVASGTQALKVYRRNAELQGKVFEAQLKAFGEKPEDIPARETQTARDIEKIRAAVEAHAAA